MYLENPKEAPDKISELIEFSKVAGYKNQYMNVSCISFYLCVRYICKFSRKMYRTQHRLVLMAEIYCSGVGS